MPRGLRWTFFAVPGGVLLLIGGIVILCLDEPEFLWLFVPILLCSLAIALVLRRKSRADELPGPSEISGPSWGPNMSKISVGGPAGLIFTLASLAVFLIGLPEVRWFLAASLPVGLIVALILRLTARD